MKDPNFVFICYADEDKAFAGALTKELRDNKLNVWLDKDSIPAGSNWPGELADAIAFCQVFVIVLSPDAIKSDYVTRELNLAVSYKRPVIPLICRKITNKSMPAKFALNLAGVQRLDFSKSQFEYEFGKLLISIMEHDLTTRPPTPKPDEREIDPFEDHHIGESPLAVDTPDETKPSPIVIDTEQEITPQDARDIIVESLTPTNEEPDHPTTLEPKPRYSTGVTDEQPRQGESITPDDPPKIESVYKKYIPIGIIIFLLFVIALLLFRPMLTTWINPTPTSTLPVVQNTQPVPITPTLFEKTITPTSTKTSTLTATNSPIPTLGIGSTMLVEIDEMLLLYVPEGEFLMGAADSDLQANPQEKPQHPVYLDAFWIDQSEVTNQMFAMFLNEMGNQQVDGAYWLDTTQSMIRVRIEDSIWQAVEGYEEYPIASVTWDAAEEYCKWAGRRLPTEAEWEKAARGTQGWKYPWGDDPITCNYANYKACGLSTLAVGSKPLGNSPYGAWDMLGNVREWVADWYDNEYYKSTPYKNPQGLATGVSKVLRGGSWYFPADDNRASHRFRMDPNETKYDVGFRCALTP